MLKKAGIVVAAVAVGLLATGSVALAQETNTEDNLTTTCSFAQDQDVTSTDAGGSGVVLPINLILDVIVPVAAQLPILSCNTVGITDAADFNSENDVESVEKTKIKDSFNEED
jgi:hypothetical protein